MVVHNSATVLYALSLFTFLRYVMRSINISKVGDELAFNGQDCNGMLEKQCARTRPDTKARVLVANVY